GAGVSAPRISGAAAAAPHVAIKVLRFIACPFYARPLVPFSGIEFVVTVMTTRRQILKSAVAPMIVPSVVLGQRAG
ncbi:MAG TPA: hypothetical protein DEH78_19625, partial [Solibacterales bacterium]|nr:hypothetical protein [Bryobacterales bacterium]